MKNYTKPNMNITKFDVESIITASGNDGVVVKANTLTGDDLAMYDVYKSSSAAKSENVSIFTW